MGFLWGTYRQGHITKFKKSRGIFPDTIGRIILVKGCTMAETKKKVQAKTEGVKVAPKAVETKKAESKKAKPAESTVKKAETTIETKKGKPVAVATKKAQAKKTETKKTPGKSTK